MWEEASDMDKVFLELNALSPASYPQHKQLAAYVAGTHYLKFRKFSAFFSVHALRIRREYYTAFNEIGNLSQCSLLNSTA